jgi:hypothetical protein
VVPGGPPGVVDEVEDVRYGFLDGDHEAHAVGPAAGNGSFVYLKEIRSMYWQSSSGRTSITRPWIAAIG